MLYTPNHIPVSTRHDLLKAFNRASTNMQTLNKVNHINTLRKRFYDKLQFIMSSEKRVQSKESLQEMKEYLYETYNLMKVMVHNASYSMAPLYYSFLSKKTEFFEMNEGGEACCTAEIIMSR